VLRQFTQFTLRNPKATLSHHGTQCPTPVFFLFDSSDILTRADCNFSDGNLASPRARSLSTAAELTRLPWEKIYHTGPFDPDQESDITFRRNAEIIVPQKLDLSSLRYICCRSVAEKETLLHLLTLPLRKRYYTKILATTSSMLFYRHHSFVESADLTPSYAILRYSPDTKSPGPFHLHAEIKHGNTPKVVPLEIPNFDVTKGLKLRFPRPLHKYTIRILLDGYLAYANSWEEIRIPF
jgi:hypothetical protein